MTTLTHPEMNQLSSHRPISIAVVFLQSGCNMSCSFCVTEDDFDPLELDQGLALLDRFVELGIRSVTFGGGEPFAWRGDVLELARQAKARLLHVQIGTNGIALPEDFAGLAEVDRWVLPLESKRAAIHDQMRRYGRSHHRIMLERLEALRLESKSVTISTVLTRVNVAELTELAEWLREYQRESGNVHAWHLYQFLPLGRGGAINRDALSISTEGYRSACRRVQEMDLPFKVFRRTDMYRSRTVEFFWNKGGKVVSGSEALHRADVGRSSGIHPAF